LIKTKSIIQKTLVICSIIFTTTQDSQASNMRASWYDCAHRGECSRSKITASGEKFNPNALTVAHKTLPLGTKLRLKHNSKTVIVRVNDRGPYVKGRDIDLSRHVAVLLGCIGSGVCRIEATIIKN